MSDALAFTNNDEVYRYLQETGGEGLRKTALFVYPQASRLEDGGQGTVGALPFPAVKGKVSFVSRSAHRLTLETDPSCRGLLVASELYYPGWEVYVDGKKKEILKTDLIFRGIMLEGGQKRVEFRFRPASLRKGIIVSLVTVGLLVVYSLILMVWGLTRRKKKRSEVIGDSAGVQ